MKSSTKTLAAAMRILARDIQSGDGVANAAIAEAADRLEELHADHLRDATKMTEQQASIAEAAPFAWATFDGEGSYDLRLYECNESYRDEWLAANGRLYAGWVIPLYEAPDELRSRIAELEAQAAIGRRAVEVLRKHQHSEDISLRASYCPECDKMQPEHAEGCELAAILRDAEQAAPHSDDLAVDRFAVAMKAKLATARAKGRGGWDDPEQCSVEFLAKLLIGHVRKCNSGNFEDIANLAMMLHQRGADPAVLEHAAPEPATVAVDAGALEALRSAMSKLRAPMSRAEYAVARAGIIEAAYRLLAGGVE